MHILLTNRYATVPHRPHDRASIRPCLAQASAEGVPQRVYHEVLRQPKQIPNFAVEVVNRRDQMGPARLSRKHVEEFLLTDAGFQPGACPRRAAEIGARVL